MRHEARPCYIAGMRTLLIVLLLSALVAGQPRARGARQGAPSPAPSKITRVTLYCSQGEELHAVAPAGGGYRAISGPIGPCRDRGLLSILAQEGTLTPTVAKDRAEGIVADVDQAFSSLRSPLPAGREITIQSEVMRLNAQPVVVTAPAKVIEKATTGLKDTLKTQV